MANRDDVDRTLAACVECGAVYAARLWPSGEIQPIGSDACDCGATTFSRVDDIDDDASRDGTSAE